MNKQEFLEVVKNYTFTYVTEQDLYVNDFDLNITLKLVEGDKCDEIYDFFDKKRKHKFCELKYYYNGILIKTNICLFGYLEYKPIYLPIPEWLNENGEIPKDHNEKIIFHFNEDKIKKLNNLIGMTIHEVFGINYLKNIDNIKIN